MQEYLNLVDWKGLELPSTEKRCKASVKTFERSPTVLAEWIELKETLAKFQAERGNETSDDKGSDDTTSKAERKRKSDASPVEFCRRSLAGGVCCFVLLTRGCKDFHKMQLGRGGKCLACKGESRTTNQNPQQPLICMIFTNADPRYAGKLDNKQGVDTIVTIERVREAIAFNAELADESTWLSLTSEQIGFPLRPISRRARGESRGFRQQPRGT